MAEALATVLDTAYSVIETRIRAQWQSGGLLISPVQFPAVLGLVDVDAVTIIDKPPTNAPWLKIDWQSGFITPGTIGPTALNNHTGILLLTVYAPRNKGTVEINLLAGQAAAIFNGFRGEPIRDTIVESVVFVPSSREEAGWLKKAATVRVFYYSERRAAA